MRTPSAVYFPVTGHHFLMWQEQGRGTWVIGGELLQGKGPIGVIMSLNTASLDNAIKKFSLAQPSLYISQYTMLYKYDIVFE